MYNKSPNQLLPYYFADASESQYLTKYNHYSAINMQ